VVPVQRGLDETVPPSARTDFLRWESEPLAPFAPVRPLSTGEPAKTLSRSCSAMRPVVGNLKRY